jgi:MFS family permease
MTDPPFPKMKVLSLASVQFVNQFASFMLYPLLSSLVLFYFPTTAPKDVGKFTWMLASSYQSGNMIGSLMWGTLGDRFGRRPVLMVNLGVVLVATALFSVAPTFYLLVFARFLWGFGSPMGTVKTSLTELLTSRQTARGFAFLGALSGLGRLVGPFISGYFATVTIRGLPKSPVLVPCAVALAIALVALVLVVAVIEETWVPEVVKAKVKKVKGTKYEQVEGEDEDEGEAGEEELGSTSQSQPETPPPPPPASPITRVVLLAIGSYSAFALAGSWIEEIFPLLCLAPQSLGGYGLSVPRLGLLYMAGSAPQILFQLAVYPALVSRYGEKKLVAYQTLATGVSAALLPIPLLISNATVRFVFLAIVYSVCSAVKSSSFTSFSVLVSNSSERRYRGRVNGTSQLVAALARVLGPLIGANLFALSVTSTSPLWGPRSTFILAAAVMTVVVAISRLLPDSINKKLEEKELQPVVAVVEPQPRPEEEEEEK